MPKPGRNDPCPCGSGKKYKKCCLRRDAPPVAGFTAEERARLLERMGRFVDDPALDDFRDEALDLFWAPLDDVDVDGADHVMAAMTMDALSWFLYFDVQIEGGGYVSDLAIEADRGVSKGERAFVAMARGTCMRLYEVADVTPGAWLLLEDLRGGERVRVRERSASQQMVRGDLLAARIVPRGASGEPEIDGGCFPFSRARKRELLGAIEELLSGLRAARPRDTELAIEKEALPPLFHAMWRRGAAMPALVNFDGDPLVMSRLVFDVRDEAAVVAALDGSPWAERASDTGHPTWHIDGEGSQQPGSVMLGRCELKRGRLEIQTNSVKRAEDLRARVEDAAGDALRYRATVTEDPVVAMRDRAGPPSPPPELPPEVVEAVQAHLAQHYAGWVDEPVPMLDGHTPREAAAMPEMRPQVVEMLRDMENACEHARRQGQPAFDPAGLWEELGLR